MNWVRTNLPFFSLLAFVPAAFAQQAFVPTVVKTPGAPSRVLYGLYRGSLVRSGDLGATWTPMYVTEAGLPQPPVQGFDVDALDPKILYLATTAAAGTFLKSTDGGATWNKAISGIPNTGGSVDFFREVLDTTVYLYLKIGNQFYTSQDRGANWMLQTTLPGSAGLMELATSLRSRMYYVEPSTLAVFSSLDEGHSFQLAGHILAPLLTNPVVTGIGIMYFNPNQVFVSVDGTGAGQAAYGSTDAGNSFTDQTGAGLGLFTRTLSYFTGPSYALTGSPITGSFRSTDSAVTWKPIGATGVVRYAITAEDPGLRTVVYGVKGLVTSPAPTALVISSDGGDSWTEQPAVITPTIAKPASIFTITLEEGAPYSAAFTLQTLEDPSWKTPVTLTTSGEPWLQVGAASGSTPLPDSITINSAGLVPGNYTSTLTIAAPQSNNKSVSIPVQLTIRPLGSLGPGYLISTVAGSGNGSDTRTSGKATDLGIGAAKALTFDPTGQLLISSGSRLWQLGSGTLTALAGTGVNASLGNGSDPLSASIADPDGIALDSQGAIYLVEYATETVRKVAGGTINTVLDMTRTNPPQAVGSHNLVFDSTNRFLLTNPNGLLRYDGLRLVVATTYPFSDPYGMVQDALGNLYISDRGLSQILKMTPAGIVSVVAGTGIAGFSGDGGLATQAMLNSPAGLALDSAGVLYIADSGNQRIRVITSDGKIRTIAGSGLRGFSGDGSTTDFASFSNPMAVAVDAQGNVFVADAGNNRVRVLASQLTPTPKPAALVNPSSALKLSPGGVFVLYGDLLAPAGTSLLTPNAAPWPRSMAGVSVTINGVLAPLYFVGATQINGQVPFETALGTATAIVTSNGSLPAQLTFPVVAAEPGILTDNGTAHATSQNQDYSRNTASNPATAGDIVIVYLSGIGQINNPLTTNTASPSTPLPSAKYPYSVTVGGQPVQVDYLGYTPTFIGLVQANIHVPAGLASGDYPVVVTVNGEVSLPANISVRGK